MYFQAFTCDLFERVAFEIRFKLISWDCFCDLSLHPTTENVMTPSMTGTILSCLVLKNSTTLTSLDKPFLSGDMTVSAVRKKETEAQDHSRFSLIPHNDDKASRNSKAIVQSKL